MTSRDDSATEHPPQEAGELTSSQPVVEYECPIVEPMDGPSLRTVLRNVLANGRLDFSKHALSQMEARNLVNQDVVNVLRAGRWESCSFENRSWRYNVATPRMVVVVAVHNANHAVVVTAWKIGKTQ
jgi:hypothetical protein